MVKPAELALVGGVIAIFVLFILPLPPVALDALIALNMTIGVILLLSVLYIAKPLDFSTFPSVLLLTTLVRLGISVATTKMILGEAEGGQIIQQFGETVAGGNLVVGLVVFTIITVVQFIVISKGSERVAEVAARFSLDAMPGKQLSIDSDLRSGLLTKDDAREKRRVVELESKLYGSLDGAMKFVKGDAIASIIIVLVNLLGGLAVGVLYHDMTMGEAATTFSILTIGDGLVAQIPAFFCATAAGLLVTRTTDEETEKELASTIARQLGGKPHVLITAGGMALLLGLVPGFPHVVFLVLGLGLMAIGGWGHPVLGLAIKRRLGLMQDGGAAPERTVVAAAPPRTVDPLLITIGVGDRDSRGVAALVAALEARVRMLEAKGGVPYPALAIAAKPGADWTAGRWSLVAYDAPLGEGAMSDAELDERLPLMVGELLRRNAPMFLGLQEVTDLINWLGESYPEVVKEAVRAVPLTTVAEVLRLLAEEQVPLSNLRDAVEAIAQAGQVERESRPIAERVRVALRRNIVAPLCVGGRLSVLMIGAEVEDAIRGTLTVIDGQERLAIDPLQMRALVSLLREQVDGCDAAAILTAQDIRRPLRLLTAADLFDVPVIAFNELNPAVPLDVVAQLDRAPALLASRQLEEVE